VSLAGLLVRKVQVGNPELVDVLVRNVDGIVAVGRELETRIDPRSAKVEISRKFLQTVKFQPNLIIYFASVGVAPILATLHLLPTPVLVWKCLHDAAPRYLADLCVPAASTDGRRQSRSAVSMDSDVYWPAQLCCV